MRFSTPLVPARLIRRYKRFLADCQLETGEEVTAHCANPGSMMGLAAPGTRIWLEPNNDPKKSSNSAGVWSITKTAILPASIRPCRTVHSVTRSNLVKSPNSLAIPICARR